jgi:hypothetical protein
MVKARLTIDQKIAIANTNVFKKEFIGVTYRYYDEAKDEDQARSWERSLWRRGYDTHVHHRLIDDIMKGKWFYAYDVYFVENITKKVLVIK